MKKAAAMAAAIATAAMLTGCSGTREDRTVGGAVVGGAAGALIGGAATGRAGGAIVGGLAGAAVGGVIGANSGPSRRCARVRYNAYGEAVCTRYVY